MYQPARAAAVKHDRLCGVHNRNQNSQFWRLEVQIKVLVFGGASLLGGQIASFCVFTWPFLCAHVERKFWNLFFYL